MDKEKASCECEFGTFGICNSDDMSDLKVK